MLDIFQQPRASQLVSFLQPFKYTLWILVLVSVKVTTVSDRALRQGMVDGSASEPVLRQDTGYMVEKIYYDIAQYLGAFGAYLMPQ